MKELLAQHALLVIAVVIFVEELGIPLLVPGDVLMMLAGIEIARGHASLGQVLLVEEAVTVAGAALLFFLSRGIGRPALLRYGHYIGLNQERIAFVEQRLSRYQFRAVVLGRLTPGLRIFIVMGAGLANLDARRFLPAVALGGFLYLLGYTLLGMYAGDAAIRLMTRLSIPASTGLSIVGLGLLFLGLRTAQRSKVLTRPLMSSPLTNLAAGIAAAGTGLLASNILTGVFVVWSRFGQPLVSTPVRSERALGLLLTWPGFFVVALALSTILPMIGLRHRARFVRVAVNALLPFLLAMLVIDPMLSGGELGWASRSTVAWAAVTGVRCLMFAFALEYVLAQMSATREIESLESAHVADNPPRVSPD